MNLTQIMPHQYITFKLWCSHLDADGVKAHFLPLSELAVMVFLSFFIQFHGSRFMSFSSTFFLLFYIMKVLKHFSQTNFEEVFNSSFMRQMIVTELDVGRGDGRCLLMVFIMNYNLT
ncbi:hypothetical protein AABB24_029843 [Solanum stoloniferum]|uniref:Uncharacterized protein n=1 Tax=Solanum stoloniferum TaxID=62892 RepID=A0ABD2S1G7_9SOLN